MANRLFQQFFFSFTKNLTGIHGYASLVAPVQGSILAQGITYTAVALGVAGNGITITLTTGGTAGAEVVTVVGKAISVQIESGVSTRTQVKAAIDGAAAAAALVTVSVASGATAATAAAAVTTAGGVNSVASFVMKGVASIAHTGTGEYTLTLQDKYNELQSAQFQLQAATAVDLVPQLKSSDVLSAKTVVVRLLAGATPTNPGAAQTMFIALLMRNSGVSL